MHRLIEISALPEYRLRLRFADGVSGIVDVSDMVGKGVFAAWSDWQHFASAAIDPSTGAAMWPGGFDLCPDALHQEIVGATSRHAL